MYNSGLRLGPVVKNPPASAGGMGSIPGPGRSHMLQAAEPVGHTIEAHALEHVRCSRRGHLNEKPGNRNLRKSALGNKDPAQPKIKLIN